MNKFKTLCINCGNLTYKSYARVHGSKCKRCVTGKERDISKHPLLCPDCKKYLLTPTQKKNHIYCDFCNL